MNEVLKFWSKLSLVVRIIIGLIIGTILGLTAPNTFGFVSIFGNLFIGALKGVAPLLVFLIVISSIAQHKSGHKSNMKSIIVLYLAGTFFAAFTAVVTSFMFPTSLMLDVDKATQSAPTGLIEVVRTLLMNLVDNPVNALSRGNFIGILAWAVLFGLVLRKASDSTKSVIVDISDGVSEVVKIVINFAPIGIMGIVFENISANGIEAIAEYGNLLVLLIGTMLFFVLVINPIIVYIYIRKNPFPLVFRCLKESGITAFFTRSSAANIPVNMRLCNDLGLDKDTYSVSIPLGATINMSGAAITIAVLTLAATNTLGIKVDFPTALILSVLAAVSACGASGVSGGSLLLIPLACSLFNISNDVAMKVVGVGFIIGVLQDSFETALNSSTDVLYTAIAEMASDRKNGKKA